MNPEYTLAAGDRINAPVPDLHIQSMEVAQATLRPGDFIEIGIERKPIRKGELPILIENVFARVEAIRWPFVDAVIHSKLHFTNHHGVQVGDTVSCSDKQILCFLPAKYPKTKGWIEFVTEKVLEMQRAFLATLALNELPQECVTKCVLNADTTVLIGFMDNKGFGIFVGVNVLEPSESALPSSGPTRNQVFFHEAAVRLEFLSDLPGEGISSVRNQLFLSIKRSASGEQLIDLVFASIEQVHHEVERALAGRVAAGAQA